MTGTKAAGKSLKTEIRLEQRTSIVSTLKRMDQPPSSFSVGNLVLHTLSTLSAIATWIGQRLLLISSADKAIPKKMSLRFPSSIDVEMENFVAEYMSGIDKPPNAVSDEAPPWLDMEKFERGKRFATSYLLGLVYGEQLSVLFLLAVPMLRKPLVYSANSDTVEKAFRRYFSTVERVVSWYNEDIWDKSTKAYRNLQIVRQMHQRTTTSTPHEPEVPSEDLAEEISSPLLMAVTEDLQPFLPRLQEESMLAKLADSKPPFVNQLGMAITQFGFVGLMILFPGKFGGWRASEDDLDDFVYVWYVLGHQLGIAERYNLCAGGLRATRNRCHVILHHIILPSLANAENEWELMARSVVAGVHEILHQTSFEATLSYALWAVGVEHPRLDSLITWEQRPRHWLFKCVLCVLHTIPGAPGFFSGMLQLRLVRLRRRLDYLDSRMMPVQLEE